MKRLFLASLCLSFATTLAFADTPDPSDPFSPDSSAANIAAYQCTSAQHATAAFCGALPPASNDTNSCLKKETVNGCEYMNAHGASIPSCTWQFEFHMGIGTGASPAFLCATQAQWCKNHGYTDCETVRQNCINDITLFRTECMGH